MQLLALPPPQQGNEFKTISFNYHLYAVAAGNDLKHLTTQK